MVNFEFSCKEESGRKGRGSFLYDPVLNSITHILISLVGQVWRLMSAALAVIGVTVFVCLTLCKRGLKCRG